MGYYYAEHIGELTAVIVAIILAVIWILFPRKSVKDHAKEKKNKK